MPGHSPTTGLPSYWKICERMSVKAVIDVTHHSRVLCFKRQRKYLPVPMARRSAKRTEELGVESRNRSCRVLSASTARSRRSCSIMREQHAKSTVEILESSVRRNS
jgi:hypothetical protein